MNDETGRKIANAIEGLSTTIILAAFILGGLMQCAGIAAGR